jgi:hypothetical protein
MLNVGTYDQFQTVRHFLKSRYTEEIAAAALGVSSIADFDKRDPRAPIRDTLVRFFFGGAAVPVREFHNAVPGQVSDALSALGLVDHSGGMVWCPCIVYPTHDLHMVSDRFLNPDGTPAAGDREFVYFALTANTQAYLRMLPGQRCESFLDMGAGCGAGALVQARYASSSVASDISPRSTLMARFNAALNDFGNVQAVEGSLYDSVKGRTFDRIGCHPPYDISSSAPWTFADGGDDGEFVIRGTVAGLPEHLARGGSFFALFRGADKEGRPLECRVREWLGRRNAEFDIALVVRGIVGTRDYALSSILSTSQDLKLYEAYMKRFEEMQVQQLVYANLLIRRKADASSAVTLRRDIGDQCTAEELTWLLDWELQAAGFDVKPAVLVLSPGMELEVQHKLVHGDLRPVHYVLRSSTPFAGELECPEWIALLVSRFAQPRSAEQVYLQMRKDGPITTEQYSAALKRLISLGVLVQAASGSRITSSS